MTVACARRFLLEDTLLEIAEQQQLVGVNAADYRTLGAIEGVAHELAHFLDLGPDFKEVLDSLPDEEANAHEAATLRIEVAALASLGVRLSMRRLRTSANWRHSLWPPALAQLQAPLSLHEQDCAGRLVDMVTSRISNRRHL